MDDHGKFPAPIYRDTVLAPLFEGFKRHHRDQLLAIHHAHGLMLAERGWLKPHELRAIFAALADITDHLDPATLVYTDEHEDFFFFVEAGLAERLGADLAGRLHTGRSRNDIDHTIFKMVLRDRLLGVCALVEALLEVLLARATAGAATLVVAYTHGQPAQPTTFGHYLGALIEMLLRDLSRLRHALATVDRCSLGAAAITTSGFGLDRARVAELLGFAAVQENSYGCIAAADYIAETYAALKIMLLGIGRFVQDLNSWTGFEIGHVRVPDAYVQVSSIMPQKRNPVPIEHLRLLCSLAAGQCDTMLLALHNTPFTDMNDSEGGAQEAGYTALDTAGRALSLLAGLMAAIEIDEARVRAHIDAACITITELADSLVRLEGVSFRQAHAVAAVLARRSLDAGESFSRLPFEVFQSAFAGVLGRLPVLDEGTLRAVGTPEHFVAVRDMQGGPAPAALAASLDLYRRELSGAVEWRHAVQARIAAATSARVSGVAAARAS